MTVPPPDAAASDRKPLQVLVVEDSPADAGLVIRELERFGYAVDWQRVDDAATFRTALASRTWDVLLSDYSMPRFSGLEALETVKTSGYDLPFIIISGTIGEETAVEAMRVGAHDYLLKDRLARLGLAVERALGEAEERRARQRAEEAIRRLNAELERRVEERTAQLNEAKDRIEAILNSTNDVIILCRTDGTVDQVNPAFDTTFRCNSGEALLRALTELVAPHHAPILEQAFETVVQTRQPKRLEVTVVCPGRVAFDADMVLSPIVEHDGRLSGVVCSLRDITEQKRMEAQLRQMLQHEMELGELKSRFVSMAAHDLRNPLAVIETAVSVIQHYSDRLTEEEEQTRYDQIHASIRVMVELLDDILTIGQVESGKLNFDPKPLELIAFCQNIAAEAKLTTGTAQFIDLSSQGACGTVHMDAKLLRHILVNLLSNAIKYSPEKATVTFTVHCESNQITFHIQDRGIGIPQADQVRLYEAFHRAENVGSTPGTGLGLAIVKQAVNLHGGTIAVESEEGVGTAFYVTIPNRPLQETRAETGSAD